MKNSVLITWVLNIAMAIATMLLLVGLQSHFFHGIALHSLTPGLLVLPAAVGLLFGSVLSYVQTRRQRLEAAALDADGLLLPGGGDTGKPRSRFLTYLVCITLTIGVVFIFATTQMVLVLGKPFSDLGVATFVVPTLVGCFFGYIIATNLVLQDRQRATLAMLREQALELQQEIAERKKTEASLLEQRNELSIANEGLASFSYSVSHDLRAPLRSINGFSSILLETHGDQLDETGREYLQRMRTAASKMGDLIDSMLTLSGIARTETVIQPTNLGTVAKQLARELEQKDPSRKVVFDVADDVSVSADENLLNIILSNLMENAWKFTGNRERAEIQVGQTQGGEGPVLFVRDNGTGFDPKYAGQLFQPFSRLHGQGEFPGMGIGLATVQRAVQRHGGRVWAESQPGEGACFYFTLG